MNAEPWNVLLISAKLKKEFPAQHELYFKRPFRKWDYTCLNELII